MSYFIKKIRPFYKRHIAKKFALRRLKFIDKLCDYNILTTNPSKIKLLEIGCNEGEDLISHLKDRNDIELYGIDLQDYGIKHDNFTMIVGDAENIEYPDNFFDITISLGVLEHIEPIEKLCRVIKEIERVSKTHFHDVPAISTFVESHTNSFLWQLKDHNKKKHPFKDHDWGGLNFFSDEAWLQFEGFRNAKTKRFSYIPLFMKSLIIYRNLE